MGTSIKIEKTIRWLTEEVSKAKTRGLLVGISGGVDSAVVAFLIKRAVPYNSLGVVLPCRSSVRDTEDAYRVIRACGIDSIKIDLESPHEELVRGVFEQLDGAKTTYDDKYRRIAEANLKVRLRMGALYAVANTINYLVVGTDNAAETYVGYFTKYGDGGVDLQPIAHITKREVGEWANVLGVPQEIIEKVPTAGLWEGQTDEEEMGTTYDMVDDFIEGKSIPERDRLIIEKLHRVSWHKRRLPPTPPKEWYTE